MKHYQTNQTEEIAQALLAGKVIAFPTDTVYGLGCIYGNTESFDRLKKAKKRPESKSVPMMCADLEHARRIVKVGEREKNIAEKLMPGALTLILEATDDLNRVFTNGKSTAAVRIPDTPWLLEVMEKVQLPLMVTSANLSGQPAALSAKEAEDMLPEIDGIVEGRCGSEKASTIIDCTQKELSEIRKGPIPLEVVLKAAAGARKGQKDKNDRI